MSAPRDAMWSMSVLSYRAERPPPSTMVQYSSCEQASCFIFRRYRTTAGLSVTSHTSRSTFSEPISMPRQTPNQATQLTVGQNKKEELESKKLRTATSASRSRIYRTHQRDRGIARHSG